MWAAAWLLLRPQLVPGGWLKPLVVFVGAIAAYVAWPVSPIQVLAAAAVVGALWMDRA
jgi:hypothetical protein